MSQTTELFTSNDQWLEGEYSLWRDTPRASWLQYAHRAPTQELEIHSTEPGIQSYKVWQWVIIFYIALLAAVFGSASFSYLNLDEYMMLGSVIFFVATIMICIFMLRYIIREDTTWDSEYVVTNQRICWQYSAGNSHVRNRLRYISHNDLTQVILRRLGDHDLIEWYGAAYSTAPANMLQNKIAFVGVEDAMELVRLVEQARGTLLPITDLRHQGDKKKSEAKA